MEPLANAPERRDRARRDDSRQANDVSIPRLRDQRRQRRRAGKLGLDLFRYVQGERMDRPGFERGFRSVRRPLRGRFGGRFLVRTRKRAR